MKRLIIIMLAALTLSGCKDDNNDTGNGKTITMTTAASGNVPLFLGGSGKAVVNWGDGSAVETVTLPSSGIELARHVYADATVRTITIKGENITYLSCDDNKLTALDVSKNTVLEVLHCDRNDLTSLDLSKNTALTTLRCEYNELTVLEISKNTALIELQCGYNQLTALDISKNTLLKLLYCSGIRQSITILDVSKNAALTVLWCNYIPITALDLSKNPALSWLKCSGCNLEKAALLDIFNALPVRPSNNRGNIECSGNPGSSKLTAAERTIPENKNWTLI